MPLGSTPKPPSGGRLLFVGMVTLLLGCGTGGDSEPKPKPNAGAGSLQAEAVETVLQTAQGSASFIAEHFEGKPTASGAPYDGSQLVAAHPSYLLGTRVRVTNMGNGRQVEVRVVDRSRGGSGAPVIDLSRAAAEALGFVREGRAEVRVEVLEWGADGEK